DGAPWAVRGTRAGGGTYLLLATPLGTDASSIPTSPAMLPLVDRLTGAWSAASAEAPTAAPGGSIVLPADAQVVVLPDDTEEPVGGSSSYRLTGPAGVYRVIGARDTLVFAVNPPASESDLTRLDADEMRGWLAGADVETVDRIDGWAGAVY